MPEQSRVSSAIHITKVRAFSYRVPTQSTRLGPLNYVIEITGEMPGGVAIVGVGEGQPRGGQTGDTTSASWSFLTGVADGLVDTSLDLASPASTVDQIRRIMDDIAVGGQLDRKGSGRRRPFRGTLLGIEVALLDLGARAHHLPLSRLLGQARDSFPPAPVPIASSDTDDEITEALQDQVIGSTHTRIVLPREADAALDLVERTARISRTIFADRAPLPFWLQTPTRVNATWRRRFCGGLVRAVARGKVPGRVIVMCSASGRPLVKLQLQMALACSLFSRRGVDIRVMGWPRTDGRMVTVPRMLGRVTRAMEVRPALVGGLLPSLDLVRQRMIEDPDTVVGLGRMAGASRITAYALRHLSLALARVDGAEVSAVVEQDVPFTRLESVREPATEIEWTDATIANGDSSQWDDGQASAEEALDQDVDGDLNEGISEAEAEEVDSPETPRSAPVPTDDLDEFGDENERVNDPDSHGEGGTAVNDIFADTRPGLGVEIQHEEFFGSIRDYLVLPAPKVVAFNGRYPREYDDGRYIRPLGSYGTHGHLLEREALAYGLNSRRFSKSTFLADDGVHTPLAFRTARSPLTSVVAASIVRHKEATRILLRRHGCPVPQGRTFSGDSSSSAIQYASRIGYPVVLKPAAGSMGVGVTANISDSAELQLALHRFRQSVLGHDEFIVEKHIRGRDYRIMVLGDEVVAAVERLPASVIGDGKSTILELILAKNAHRKHNPHLGTLKLKWNSTSRHEVAKAGYGPETVLPSGETLFLNSANNLTQGGDSVEVLDELHPSIIEASIAAVKAVPGLTYCGVDFLLEDHRRPLVEQEGAICELNAVAAIPVAEYPPFGTPRPLAEKFLRKCIDQSDLVARPTRSEHLNLRLQIRGKLAGVGYPRWFARRAEEFGCSGWIKQTGKRRIEVRISGATAAASAMVAAAILGPRGAIPTSVYTTHEDDSLSGGFTIIGSGA